MVTDVNRLKLVLVEEKRTNNWLCEQFGVNPSTVPNGVRIARNPICRLLLKLRFRC